MKVYKFGGASVKSADAVRNILNIINQENENLIIVVSAMGKTTNKLEIILDKYFKNESFKTDFEELKKYHFEILKNLFSFENKIFDIIILIFSDLEKKLNVLTDKKYYDKKYDEIISFGEVISSTIVSYFLNENRVDNKLINAHDIIKTDSNFRAANIDFAQTSEKIIQTFDFLKNRIFITQGFIGSDNNNEPTTLGREGSDYTASIIAGTLNATELVLWKDVDGIFNADPKLVENVVKLDQISYREATELAYFGAKVIHPKTVKPIMNKDIKLTVRSFVNRNSSGTTVGAFEHKISPFVPVTILKKNQVLLTISSKDFEFIDEHIFEKVFSILNLYKIKINLMQNSALNLSLCFDFNPNSFENFTEHLKNHFNFRYNKDLTLITIRHYSNEIINNLIKEKKIKLEQKTRLNAFFLVEN